MPLSRLKKLITRLWKSWRAPDSAPKHAFIPQRKTPPPLPSWSKKDWFEAKEMGTMVPPEEMADAGTLRRPGKWLEEKMTHHDKQLFEITDKNKRPPQQVADDDLEKFLQDLLKPSEGDKTPESDSTASTDRKKLKK